MSKVAIVTGGTRGIGLAISQGLIADGYKVAAAYRSDEEAAQKFRDLGGYAIQLDVSNFDSCQNGVKEIESELGPVDVLVNNAGITRDGVLHKMEEDAWHAVIETNLTSCFSMCRAVVGGMRERGFGRIVNISSINGEKGQFGQTNYAAAKAGILGFTKALALETAKTGVTVNALCPGFIDTPLLDKSVQTIVKKTGRTPEEARKILASDNPQGRLIQPEEVAASALWLCSDASASINGQAISISGGEI